MGKEKTNIVDSYDEVKTLERELLILQRDLKLTKSRARRRELREYIDELKIEMGWALMDCREYEQALLLYRSLPWRTCGEMKCNGMARALTEMGFYDEARKLLEAGLSRFPDSYALWVAMAALYESIGDYFESLRCLEGALQFSPEDNSTGLYNKALILMKIGSYGDAVSMIEDLIERCPEDPKYLAERGALALDMGYPQEALRYYQKAMELWKRSPTTYEGICAYSGLCSSYMGLEMKKEALEVAMEGLKQFPDDEELKKFLKDIEDDADDPDDGEKPPLLGLILLMALLYKKFRKK